MRSSTRRWLIALSSVVIVASLAFLLGMWATDFFQLDQSAFTSNASVAPGPSRTVVGIINGYGATFPDQVSWSARLDVETSGAPVAIVINRYTRLTVSPDHRRAPDAEPGNPFPYLLWNDSVSARVKTMPAGFLGLGHQLVASEATISSGSVDGH